MTGITNVAVNTMNSHEYIANLFCKNTELEEVYNTVSGRLREIQVNPILGQMLYMIVKLSKIKSMVEIGSLIGYSSICMARALPDDGILYSIELSPERCESARANHKKLGLEHKIVQIEGDAKQKLQELRGPFDAVFIDADKGGYCAYLDWAENNIVKNGLILADNALLFDSIYLKQPPTSVSGKSWVVMRDFNKRISNNKNYDSIILPVFDGLLVAKKKV